MPRSLRLAWRNVCHFWLTNTAAVASVAAAAAALTGALLVGDSLRGSLRASVLDRLGGVVSAVQGPRYFREALASQLPDSAPVLTLQGGLTHADSRRRAERVEVLGCDDRFLLLHAGAADSTRVTPTRSADRVVVLNDTLAAQLGAAVGDDVLLRVGRAAEISTESVLGRRDEVAVTLRLTVRQVIGSRGPGAFSLQASAAAPPLALVPLAALQQVVGQPGRVNTLLVGRRGPTEAEVQAALTLDDYGLRVRVDEAMRLLTVESRALMVEPAFEAAARSAGERLGWRPTATLAYLANEIATVGPAAAQGRAVPYSTVVAIEPGISLPSGAENSPIAAHPRVGEILLNDWTLAQIGLTQPSGERIRLSYYVNGPHGTLETRSAEFKLAGRVAQQGAGADRAWTPEYPGITDARRIGDWDPPFPVDLRRITPADEAYWDEHRAAPKAFIAFEDGLRLWADQPDRLGRVTSLRFGLPSDASATESARRFEVALLASLDPRAAGLSLTPVRESALRAATGSTDFGGLFLGFSFFLIAAALALVVLVQRLSVERRAREVGLLLALGWRAGLIRRVLLVEALLLCGTGVLLGQFGARAYAALMVHGLGSWWVDAVGTRALSLHTSPLSFWVGGVVGLGLALAATAWALRGMLRGSVRSLLAGQVPSEQSSRTPRFPIVAVLLLAASGGLVLAGGWSGGDPLTFFGAGATALAGGIALCNAALRRAPGAPLDRPGAIALLRHASRNLRRRRSRSVLVVGLLAAATFLIVALESMQLRPPDDLSDPRSGSGGYALIGESAVPVLFDLNSAEGRERLSLRPATRALLDSAQIAALRLRPGDEASCTSLYQPSEPRIVGISREFAARGGFTFAAAASAAGPAEANPWLLLDEPLADGAIPAIGDEAAVRWQLKLGLGRDLELTDERGRPQRLRFVALLRGSALQSEVLISESRFEELFPSQSGRRFFLIRAPQASAAAVADALEQDLEPFALDLAPAADRLRGYLAVQNTYIRTFQALGGVGLLLGAIGVAAVVLRSIWERRAELALLVALGWPARTVRKSLLVEHLLLVFLGLGLGVAAAGLALLPVLMHRGAADLPWVGLGLMLGGVGLCATLAAGAAVVGGARGSLVAALRSE